VIEAQKCLLEFLSAVAAERRHPGAWTHSIGRSGLALASAKHAHTTMEKVELRECEEVRQRYSTPIIASYLASVHSAVARRGGVWYSSDLCFHASRSLPACGNFIWRPGKSRHSHSAGLHHVYSGDQTIPGDDTRLLSRLYSTNRSWALRRRED
jgi:hypothetical protein